MSKSLLALAAGLALVACGGNEESPRKLGGEPSPEIRKVVQGATPEPRGEREVPSTPEEVSRALHEYWMWPENGGPHAPLEEDHAECVAKIENDTTRGAPLKPFQVLALQIQCLEEKGWVAR